MLRSARFKLEQHLRCGGGVYACCSAPGLWANWPVPRGKAGIIRALYKKKGKGAELLLGVYGVELCFVCYSSLSGRKGC